MATTGLEMAQVEFDRKMDAHVKEEWTVMHSIVAAHSKHSQSAKPAVEGTKSQSNANENPKRQLYSAIVAKVVSQNADSSPDVLTEKAMHCFIDSFKRGVDSGRAVSQNDHQAA
jgi:hypothetical protein